jgi:hypothetical protein
VTVVRREVNNKVLFLYADDLNREGTEDSIRVLLSTKTTTEFYPPTAEWIKCYNFTYRPHSNECGPRALLASTLLAVHPNPSAHTLMPLMHKNLAQIARTWIGGQLLQPEFDEAAILPFLGTSHPFHLTCTDATSSPADLIQWLPINHLPRSNTLQKSISTTAEFSKIDNQQRCTPNKP